MPKPPEHVIGHPLMDDIEACKADAQQSSQHTVADYSQLDVKVQKEGQNGFSGRQHRDGQRIADVKQEAKGITGSSVQHQAKTRPEATGGQAHTYIPDSRESGRGQMAASQNEQLQDDSRMPQASSDSTGTSKLRDQLEGLKLEPQKINAEERKGMHPQTENAFQHCTGSSSAMQSCKQPPLVSVQPDAKQSTVTGPPATHSR